MFCHNCGKEIDNNAVICIHCGVSTGNSQNPINSNNDNPSNLAGIASCCFPIVGLVLYFLWKDEKPNSAKLICNWMIGGLVAWAAFYFFFFVIGMLGA